MSYMTNRKPSQTHEWWNDERDAQSQHAFLQSYRSAQREQSAQGWRRIASYILLAIGVFYLASTLVSL
ncbi:conserved hypothetical protein [Burkholderiales bacterium 8X]|nr:conserved hypothetical protein [Burkholderiales bacterium 8X]